MSNSGFREALAPMRLALVTLALFLPASSVQRAWAVPLYTSLGIPLVLMGLFAVCVSDRLRTRTMSSRA